jgi:hypothetical protein
VSGLAFGGALAAGIFGDGLGDGRLLAVGGLDSYLATGSRLGGPLSLRRLAKTLGGFIATNDLGLGGQVVARSILAAAGGSARSILAAGGGSGSGHPLDFRRRGAPPRRRRRSPLLALAKPLGLAALTVALPLSLGAWLLTSSQFQLHGIDVGRESAPWAATARVPAPWVRQTLAPLLGRNLLRLPLAEVRQRLAANSWIATAEVAKELPDRLRVTVAERRPAVLLRGGAGAGHDALLYADAAGRPMAAVGSPAEEAAARRRGLLVVGLPQFAAAAAAGAGGAAADATAAAPATAAPAASRTPAPSALPPSLLAPPGTDAMPAAAATAVAGALRLADQLRRLRPGWTAALSQIDVVDEDDYQLRVQGLPCPLLVRGSRLADNLVRFDQLLPELRRRYPALAAVDLRFSRRIVIQPAQGTPPIQPVKAAQPVERVKAAQPAPPAQVVKPVAPVKPAQPVARAPAVPPAPAAKTMAPPAPAAPTSSRGSDNL